MFKTRSNLKDEKNIQQQEWGLKVLRKRIKKMEFLN